MPVPPLTCFDTLFPRSVREKEFIQTAYTHIHIHTCCQVQQPFLVTPWHCSQRTRTHTPACLEQESFRGAAVEVAARVCVLHVCVHFVSLTGHHLPRTPSYPVSDDLSITHAHATTWRLGYHFPINLILSEFNAMFLKRNKVKSEPHRLRNKIFRSL